MDTTKRGPLNETEPQRLSNLSGIVSTSTKPNSGVSQIQCCVGYKNTQLPGANRPIYAYVDQIFDQDSTQGIPLFSDIDTGGYNQQKYIISAEFVPSKGCCGPCLIGVESDFTIKSLESVVLETGLINPDDINREQITINNQPIRFVEVDGNQEYTVYFAQRNFINKQCAAECAGTPNEMVIYDIGPWYYIAQHTLKGKVSNNGVTCDFTIVIIDNPATGGGFAGDDLQTFVVDYICVPNSEKPPVVKFTFTGEIKLINPSLSVELIDPNNGYCEGTEILVLRGKLIFTPQINTEVQAKREICIPQHQQHPQQKGYPPGKPIGKRLR